VDIDQSVREAFDRLWREGYDGKDLVLSFARVAAAVVCEEQPDDMAELRRVLAD
jgi:hypothetical protein